MSLPLGLLVVVLVACGAMLTDELDGPTTVPPRTAGPTTAPTTAPTVATAPTR